MLPVLLCWIIKLFGWSKRFKCLGKDYRFFWREIELGFARTCYRPKLCLLLSSISHSLVSDLKNLVQSSKSKSTLTQQHVQEKGICSHPQKQGPGKDICQDSNWLQPKFAVRSSQNCRKWKKMLDSCPKNCTDWTSSDLLFKDFLSNLLLKMVIYSDPTALLTNHPGPSISYHNWILKVCCQSVQSCHFSIFWVWWAAWWASSSQAEQMMPVTMQLFNWVLKWWPASWELSQYV